MQEHRLNFGNDERGFTPTSGERDSVGTYGKLATDATGDWSWKPHRDKSLGDRMVTYKPQPCPTHR